MSKVSEAPSRAPAGRYLEVDVMKAVAIVAVVLIHSIHPFWVSHVSLAEQLIRQATRFAVPTFLAVSGFLYYRSDPIPLASIVRRLRRILFPYCCVSLAAYAYGRHYPGHASTTSLLSGLVLAGTFGPYYYIFLLTEFVCASWLLSRLPAVAVTTLLVLALGSAFLTETQLWMPVDLFWAARSPHFWAVWFLLGWVAAAHRRAVLAFTSKYRSPILTCWALFLLGWLLLSWAGGLRGRSGRVVEFTMIVANIVGLFGLKRGAARLSGSVRAISEWTYSIYLLHPFFVYASADMVGPAIGLSNSMSVVLAWLAGLSGAIGTTMAARCLLGSRSRDIIGA